MFWYNTKDVMLDISVVRNSTDSADLAYLLLHINTYRFPFQEINVFVQSLNSSSTNETPFFSCLSFAAALLLDKPAFLFFLKSGYWKKTPK